MDTRPCQLCFQPSVYYCTCQDPPIFCCHVCSYVHHQTPGAHDWIELDKEPKRETLCGMCERKPAEEVCCCEFPVKAICGECKESHAKMGDCHFFQPIAKAQLIQSQVEFDRCQQVISQLRRIDTYLSQNKEAAENFKTEVTAFADDLIAQVNTQKAEALQHTNDFILKVEDQRKKLKEEVEELILEQGKERRLRLAEVALDAEDRFDYEGDVVRPVLDRGSCIRGFVADFREPKVISMCARNQPKETIPPVQPPTEIIHPLSSSTNIAEFTPSHSVSQSSMLPNVDPVIEISEELKAEVHEPCKENFHQRLEEIPKTIGRHRLPFDTLQSAFKWNKVMVSKFQQLGAKYSTWRRCRGDGNCFYRCVGVLLCEHYCRTDTQLTELAQFYKSVMDQAPPYNLIIQETTALGNIKLWVKILKELHETRKKGENAFQKLQYFLQMPRVDRAIVLAMRSYTASCFQASADSPEVRDFLLDGPEPVLREIMAYGTEAEGVSLMFTARALRVVLHILTVDNSSTNVTDTVFGPAENGWYPALHLLHLPGHYQILIPREWDAVDRYDFIPNTYSPATSGKIVDFEEYRVGT